MQYTILGEPQPLSRARIGFGARHMYDSQKDAKRAFAIHIQNQHGRDPFFQGPLHLDITFYMKMPKVKKRNLPSKRYQYHYYKADLSNLIKFVEDVSEKILYENDCQIAYITARKIYHDIPRTEFTVKELKGKCEEAQAREEASNIENQEK